ncbi:MAG: PKD domain-containing protein, partial [Thermoplasmata archaeon]
MSKNLSAHYILGNDINASNASAWNSGAGFAPIGTSSKKFTGSFDGKNYTITGLVINRSSTSNVGLFGFVDTTDYVRNVGLVKCNVTGSSSVGGLVGYLSRGTVSNSYVKGNVTGKSSNTGGLAGYVQNATVDHSYTSGGFIGVDRYTGGLVGWLDKGLVNNSNSSGFVGGSHFQVGGLVGYINLGTVSNSHSAAIVNGSRGRVGGLVGESWGMISYSYATGNVSGRNKLGGLVGFNHANVTNSYATGNITRHSGTGQHQGGFMGSMSGDSTLNCYSTGKVVYSGVADPTTKGFAGHVNMNPGGSMKGCFWDKETSLQSTTSGTATAKSTKEMKVRNTFESVGWNFSGTWWIHEKVTYPLLRWQDGGYPLASAGPDLTVVNGTLVKFDGTGSSDREGLVNYTWNFTDGTPVKLYGVQPTYRFDNFGKFVVTLNVTNKGGRWATDMVTVSVIDVYPPVADAGPDQSVDEGTLVTFDGSGSTDNLKIVNWTWTFSDVFARTLHGVNPTYLFKHPSVIVVTLNVSDAAGNWDMDNMTVTVNDTTPPVAEAGPDQIAGEDTVVTFDGSESTDNVGIVNYTWTFNDGTGDITLYGVAPSHTFTLLGLYHVTLTVIDATGLRASDGLNVTVQDVTSPVSVAGPDQTVDEGELVMFDGSGSTDNMGVVNYTWTFNDGTDDITLHGVAPTHTFNVPGIFQVTLNVTDAIGLWDVATMTVTVRDITSPVAHAGPDQTVDEDTVVTFDGTASSDNVGVVNHTWTFNDGSDDITLYGDAPSHTFDHPGDYTVTLSVMDAVGLTGVDVMTVTVRDITSPVARAGPDQTVDEDTEVAFDGTTSTDNVGVAEYAWTLDDGTGDITLVGANPSHTFAEPGVYEVTLTVRDAAGLAGSDTLTVTVKDVTPPVADAGPDQTVEENSLVTFDGEASLDNVGITMYTWTFTEGANEVTLYGATSMYAIGAAGVYTVTLEVIDAVGLKDTDVMTLTVRDGTSPVADAGPHQTVEVHTEVTFDGAASVDNVGIADYAWTFNDG